MVNRRSEILDCIVGQKARARPFLLNCVSSPMGVGLDHDDDTGGGGDDDHDHDHGGGGGDDDDYSG